MHPTIPDTIGTDILRGVGEIAEFIGEKNHKKVYYWLSRGMLPAGKLAGSWTASRVVLRQHYERLTSGAPTPVRPDRG